MKQVLIVGNPDKPGVQEMIDRVQPWLAARCEIVGVRAAGDGLDAAVDCDFVLVFGGDGTMLSAARELDADAAPAVGVNLGTVGFLTEISPDEFEPKLERVLAGEGQVSERMMLECAVIDVDGARHGPFTALNDAVITRTGHSHTLDLEIWIDGVRVSDYRGDGFLVSTPTGSTGYNLSAGGPLVSPGVSAMVLTAICAHSLTTRPVVISSRECVELRMPPEEARAHEAVMIADGQIEQPLKPGGAVEIRRSERTFRLLELAGPQHYQTMRDKLHWGRSVKRES